MCTCVHPTCKATGSILCHSPTPTCNSRLQHQSAEDIAQSPDARPSNLTGPDDLSKDASAEMPQQRCLSKDVGTAAQDEGGGEAAHASQLVCAEHRAAQAEAQCRLLAVQLHAKIKQVCARVCACVCVRVYVCVCVCVCVCEWVCEIGRAHV